MTSNLTHLSRRVALLLAAILLCLGTASAARAQSTWQDRRADLGGWLDVDTGLVWGQHSRWSGLGSSWSWNGVQNTFLPRYRTQTGIQAWRMPTLAESQTAAAHGIYGVLVYPVPVGIFNWTSTTKGSNSAYAVEPSSGNSTLYTKTSGIGFIPVYRAFTP